MTEATPAPEFTPPLQVADGLRSKYRPWPSDLEVTEENLDGFAVVIDSKGTFLRHPNKAELEAALVKAGDGELAEVVEAPVEGEGPVEVKPKGRGMARPVGGTVTDRARRAAEVEAPAEVAPAEEPAAPVE